MISEAGLALAMIEVRTYRDDLLMWMLVGIMGLGLLLMVMTGLSPRGRRRPYVFTITDEGGRVIASQSMSMARQEALLWAVRESQQAGVAEVAVSEEIRAGVIETRIWSGGVYQRRARARVAENGARRETPKDRQ